MNPWRKLLLFTFIVILPAIVVGVSNFKAFPDSSFLATVMLLTTVGVAGLFTWKSNHATPKIVRYCIIADIIICALLCVNVGCHWIFSRELSGAKQSTVERHSEEDREEKRKAAEAGRQVALKKADADLAKAEADRAAKNAAVTESDRGADRPAGNRGRIARRRDRRSRARAEGGYKAESHRGADQRKLVVDAYRARVRRMLRFDPRRRHSDGRLGVGPQPRRHSGLLAAGKGNDCPRQVCRLRACVAGRLPKSPVGSGVGAAPDSTIRRAAEEASSETKILADDVGADSFGGHLPIPAGLGNSNCPDMAGDGFEQIQIGAVEPGNESNARLETTAAEGDPLPNARSNARRKALQIPGQIPGQMPEVETLSGAEQFDQSTGWEDLWRIEKDGETLSRSASDPPGDRAIPRPRRSHRDH